MGMQITILGVGKIKEAYLKQGLAHYAQRLKPYCSLKMIEVADEPAPDRLSEEELRQVQEKEGERLMTHLKADQYVIALELGGVEYTSLQLAEHLNRLALYGKSKVVFIIGGSNGLAEKVLKRAHLRLSFSKLTFPHQLMRLILLEQIYRSFKIIKGEPYHK
jgi:23S rRNA (pseudouridine1915-N3)-methyltransferase